MPAETLKRRVEPSWSSLRPAVTGSDRWQEPQDQNHHAGRNCNAMIVQSAVRISTGLRIGGILDRE